MLAHKKGGVLWLTDPRVLEKKRGGVVWERGGKGVWGGEAPNTGYVPKLFGGGKKS